MLTVGDVVMLGCVEEIACKFHYQEGKITKAYQTRDVKTVCEPTGFTHYVIQPNGRRKEVPTYEYNEYPFGPEYTKYFVEFFNKDLPCKFLPLNESDFIFHDATLNICMYCEIHNQEIVACIQNKVQEGYFS